MSFWECHCDCHKFGGKHCVACCMLCPRCGRKVIIGMEDLHAKECKRALMQISVSEKQSLTSEEQAVVDDAKDLMEKVLARITQSTKQYGTDYVLANVMKETEEEMLDIIGWPLLEVIRMKQLFLKKLSQLDGKYLDKFLENQTFEYLSYLKDKINKELTTRS